MEKTYLGNSVYVEPGAINGEILLTTDNFHHRIYLDPKVWKGLVKFVTALSAEQAADAR